MNDSSLFDLPSVPTRAVDKLWRYIEARETIRLKKEAGEPWPWTNDKILSTFKFTNVKREHDRTTKHLMAIYEAHAKAKPKVALFNAGLYRYFGTMAFADEVGWLTEYDKRRIVGAARSLFKRGQKVFTGAYIITNAGLAQPKEITVADYLRLLWRRSESIAVTILTTRSWGAGFDELTAIKGFGGAGFMAKEILSDFLLWMRYSGHPEVLDEASFTPVGPGARRGLNRLFGRDLRSREPIPKFQAEIAQLRSAVDERWTSTFKGAAPLTAHDIQFCLCEVDKYERVRLGQGRPRSLYRPAPVKE